MKIFVALSIFALLLGTSWGFENGDAFKSSLENFSHSMFKQIRKYRWSDNIIYSPFSIQTCLTMARMGAEGETAQEMDTVLGVTPQLQTEAVANNYQNILTRYQNSSVLHLANKVYIMKGYEPEDEFKQMLSQKFLTSIDAIDFGQSEQAAATINEWVESKTNHTIKDMLPANALNANHRLLLLSAIHFRGMWETAFSPSDTHIKPFYLNGRQSVEVPMMYKMDEFEYDRIRDLNASVIRLPYKASDLSMLIFLPLQKTGLAKLEQQLMDRDLETITKGLRRMNCQLTLPKFKAKLKFDLSPILMKLGLRHMFRNANLSKMLQSVPDLSVSKMLHMAVIEVSEWGTEAAAVTEMLPMQASLPARFRADHPFHYMIVNSDNIILFQGNVAKF